MINQFDPEQHRVVETEQIRYLRRETGMQDFISVHMLQDDVWSVAVWVDKGRGQFRELKVLKRIQDLDRPAMHDLRLFAAKKTGTLAEWRKEAISKRRSEDQAWHEQNLEAAENKAAIGRAVGRRYGQIAGDNPEWKRPGFQVRLGDN